MDSTTTSQQRSTTHSYDYDLLVIGGGSGGIASAKRSAQLYTAKAASESVISRLFLFFVLLNVAVAVAVHFNMLGKEKIFLSSRHIDNDLNEIYFLHMHQKPVTYLIKLLDC